jgi:hypothetical protein
MSVCHLQPHVMSKANLACNWSQNNLDVGFPSWMLRHDIGPRADRELGANLHQLIAPVCSRDTPSVAAVNEWLADATLHYLSAAELYLAPLY